MTSLLLQFILFLLLAASSDGNMLCGKRIVGYYASGGVRQLNGQQLSGLTHLIYAEGTRLSSASGQISLVNAENFNATWMAARNFSATLKFMVSMGGWFEESANYSVLLNTNASRTNFQQNILAFLDVYQVDGIEFDWEYLLATAPISKVQRDKVNYIAFLRQLRLAFDLLPRRPLLSIVCSGNTDEFFSPNGTELELVLDAVDFLNIKAYDYYGNWNWQTGPPSPLYDALPVGRSESSEGKYADWTLKYYGCRTNRLQKLNFLFALHGYYWKAKTFPRIEENNGNVEDGMWRAARAPFTGGVLAWRHTSTMFDINHTVYNSRAEAPYIYEEEAGLYLGFENERSIRAKIDYVHKYGIGGLTVYAIDYDDNENTLSQLIVEIMGNCPNEKAAALFNCTTKQDAECTASNGTCMPGHRCSNTNSNDDNFLHGKCQSSLANDIVCCLDFPPSLLGKASETTANHWQIIVPVLILVVLLLATVFACGISIKKWVKHNTNLSSSTSTTTTTAVIKYDNDSSDELIISQGNTAFDLQLARDERPSFDPVSTFSDQISGNELDKRWQFIRQNAANLLINGRVYKDVTAQQFERICVLGQGNYGQVSKCRYMGMDVAMKKIKITSDQEVRRALVDLRVLRICRNKHITTYYGYLIDENHLYICMEAMATCLAKVLDNDLQRKRGFPETVVGKVANSVVRALEYLRGKHNLMHRDVKPSNILLGREGIKLCDFGISGRLKESKAAKMMTTNIGALAYLAPERTQLDKVYDIKADVWSLGITLLELSTGVHPFEAPSELELVAKIQSATAESIFASSSKVTADSDSLMLTAELTSFIKCCLHREFSKRPNYRQLMASQFLKLYERIPVDVWLWYKRIKDSQLKNGTLLEIC